MVQCYYYQTISYRQKVLFRWRSHFLYSKNISTYNLYLSPILVQLKRAQYICVSQPLTHITRFDFALGRVWRDEHVYYLFQTNKPIMEKKRRARINQCLNELKDLLIDATNTDVSYSPLFND